MKKRIIFLIIVLNFVLNGNARSNRIRRIVGGAPAAVPASDDPVVFLRYAGRSAAIRGVLEFPHYRFVGIRYADSPTGKDRFQRPKKYFLNGEYNATTYPQPCIQTQPGDNSVIGSEDCLFLNVFTPNLPDGTEGLPVVVWIHGGGFRHGSASQYGVRYLVDKSLVLVTIQYRLGSLGFLSSGTLELPGNVALFDMALAVEWVRNHIGFFGGNPHKIVTMGQGTGASSALLLAFSDIAKGIASGVVAMSGTAVSHWAIDNTPAQTAAAIADYHGCPHSILTMVRCLQNIPAESIIRGDSELESKMLQKRGFISALSGVLGSSPVTEGMNDGRSLPALVQRKPLDDMYFGRTPKIPLLTGITRDETKKAINGRYRNEVIDNLKSVEHFLDNVLIKNLQGFTGLGDKNDQNSSQASSFWNTVDPLQFRRYIQTTKDGVEGRLGIISEVTGDALFNLPAFLTADLWSKNGTPAYLYRFEHFGQARKGDVFLKGMPIIGNYTGNDLNDTVSHGDELAYLFEARGIDGSPLKGPEVFSEEDNKVRQIFTHMISDFVRFGKVSVNNEVVPSFSSSMSNFIQIGLKPEVSNNFRYCEMALWAGLAERLQSTTCEFLNIVNTNINTVLDYKDKIGVAPEIPLLGALGPSKSQSSKKAQGPFNVFG